MMKGRSTFTGAELGHIRARLRELRNSPREQQKVIRAGLRRAGFYISDWTRSSRGLTVVDLDLLVRAGRIVILR